MEVNGTEVAGAQAILVVRSRKVPIYVFHPLGVELTFPGPTSIVQRFHSVAILDY